MQPQRPRIGTEAPYRSVRFRRAVLESRLTGIGPKNRNRRYVQGEKKSPWPTLTKKNDHG
jgi:hypothetical protein